MVREEGEQEEGRKRERGGDGAGGVGGTDVCGWGGGREGREGSNRAIRATAFVAVPTRCRRAYEIATALSRKKKMSTQAVLDPFGRAVLSIHEGLTHLVYNFNPVAVLRELQDEDVAGTLDEGASTDEDDIEANVAASDDEREAENGAVSVLVMESSSPTS